MQLVEVDPELCDHMGDERQDQRGDVALEQAVEAAADAVVVERWQLGVREPEGLGIEPRGPFADAVEWLAAEEQVLEQERDADRGSDPAASISVWEVGAEELVKAHAFEESIDDRQGADAVGGECASPGVSDLTRAWGIGGTRNVAFVGFLHPRSPDEGVNGERQPHGAYWGHLNEGGILAVIPTNMVVRREKSSRRLRIRSYQR